jgi:hypothetical protein
VKSTPAGPPTLEAAPARGDFVHDGFYLRLAVGGSYGVTTVQTDRVSQPDVRMSGFGGAFDLWCGLTLASGLVLGPALSVSSQRSGHATISGRTARAGVVTSALLGAFIDAYPNPRRGEHFGGLLALATLGQTTADQQAATDFDGGGVGLSAFAGYDAWIGRAWSLGALLRVGGTVTRGSQSVEDRKVEKQATSYGAALLVTMVYQ